MQCLIAFLNPALHRDQAFLNTPSVLVINKDFMEEDVLLGLRSVELIGWNVFKEIIFIDSNKSLTNSMYSVSSA